MKRQVLTLAILLGWLVLNAAAWQTITNTSHVHDLMAQDGSIYFSTWGGVVQLMPPPAGGDVTISEMLENRVLTTAAGLASNDVRNLAYVSFSQSLWLGSSADGISIVNPLGVQQLNTDLGLPSNRVTGIVEYGSNILVATNGGLALYYYLEGVNFPLQLHQYTAQNTGGGLLSNSIDAMALAANDYLFLSSNLGLNFVHLDSLDIDSAWHSFASPPFAAGSENKLSVNQEKLLIATPTSAHLHSSDPWTPGWQSYNQTTGILGEVIASACIDELNTIWLSYGLWNEDLLIYTRSVDTLLTSIASDGAVSHMAKFESGLGDKSIRRIVSHEGRIYLCSWGDGIFAGEGNGGQWSNFRSQSIGFPKVRNIATDAKHAAWFSSGALSAALTRKSSLGASKFYQGWWETFTIANSPIHTDNVFTVAVDSHDRKWFGTFDVNSQISPPGWRFGVSVWDEENDVWKLIQRSGTAIWNDEAQNWGAYIPGSAALLGNTAVHISQDTHGNMLIACYDDGFTVLGPDDNHIGEFLIPNSVDQRSIYSFHNGRQYFFGTNNDRGLVIWNDDSIPVTDGGHWLIPDPSDLSNCEVYGVVTLTSPYEGIQHWIAASTGLFMWNEQNWYRWDTSIKRFKYNGVTRLWENDLLYYEDEERLYGSVRTTPTAIYLDPFNRVWIGSLEHGISMYNPQTERFTNYFQANSPLLSNYITALGYLPMEGLLLVGTPEGLNTLSIGRSIKPVTTLQNLKIHPNPFRPDGRNAAIITNSPEETMPRGQNQCRIYDASGALVIKLEENEFARFAWDGFNLAGKKCGTGVYFVIVNDAKGNRATGKIALIR
ncbi:MAG: hypothetical protein K0B87_05850 [Candidatus Syntrophosphaera sp.]|nr:hypothetical protein [Candidatus Syntrophosphaera sp.]